MISCSPFFFMQNPFHAAPLYAERFSVSGSQCSFSISRTNNWPFGMDRRSFLRIVPDRTIV